MTTSISTSNPPATGAGVPAASSVKPPGEAQARLVPAGVAGAAGQSPEPLVTTPSADSAEPLYYFLESARSTSPQVAPVLNLAPPSLDPILRGSVVPATATAADPRGLPGRTAPPGQHHGSTAPATPPVEIGAQPFAPEVPPASTYGLPKEQHLRGAPAAASGAAGTSPQPAVIGVTGYSDVPYLLEPSLPTSPGAVPAPAGVPGGGQLYFVEEALAFAKASAGRANAASGGAGVLPEIIAAQVPAKA